jgi:predicted permease
MGRFAKEESLMSLFSHLREFFSRFFHRSQVDADLDEEFLAHIQRQAEDLERSGLSRPEAERRARMAFGSSEKAKEQCREELPVFWLETLWRDAIFGCRMLRKSPGFAAVAILTLALGIGVNTAIFSVVNGLFLHPPGVNQPDRLVVLRARYGKLGLRSLVVSAPDFAQIRDSKSIFQYAALEAPSDFNYSTGAFPERLRGAQVSWQWFDVFGARPMLGRVFTPEEDQPNAGHEVVLAYSAWRRWFGGDPSIVGRSVRLNQEDYRVIGVMAQGFAWPDPQIDVWAPLELAPADFAPNQTFNENYFAVACLQPGVSFLQASTYLNALVQRMIDNPIPSFAAPTYARDSQWGLFLLPLTTFIFGNLQTPILILGGAVAFVLLIACANIAGLLLAKAAGRSKELAVRAVLGASRARLIAQALSENVILGLVGIAAGLLVSYVGVRALLLAAPENLEASPFAFPLDGYVMSFTAIIGLLAVFVFAVVPAWHMSAPDPSDALHESGRSTTASRARQRFRSFLVAGELALGLALLAGTGLLLKSLSRISQVDPGFEPHGVMTAGLALPQMRYEKPEKQIAFFRAVLDRLSSTPGITAAGAGFPIPFTGSNSSGSFFIEGRPVAQGDAGPWGDVRYVTPGYFTALSIPLLKGRFFTDSDRTGSQTVAIVDENMARQYWPNEDPLGKQIRRNANDPWAVIVGVVGHIRFTQLAGDDSSNTSTQSSSAGVYYFPSYQTQAPFGFLIAKSTGDPSALAGAIRQSVRDVDPNQPVSDVKSMHARIADSLEPQRFATSLLAVFAILATLLSAIGLYGLVSYSITQRTNELGIRLTLGASRTDILGMILRESARIALIGTGAGIIVGLLLMYTLRSVLYGVSAYDPASFGGSALALILVAAVASFFPARRATRVDPIVALRYE